MESTILRRVAVLRRHAHLPRGTMERVWLARFRVSAPIQWEDVVRRNRRMCEVMACIHACRSCGVVPHAAGHGRLTASVPHVSGCSCRGTPRTARQSRRVGQRWRKPCPRFGYANHARRFSEWLPTSSSGSDGQRWKDASEAIPIRHAEMRIVPTSLHAGHNEHRGTASCA